MMREERAELRLGYKRALKTLSRLVGGIDTIASHSEKKSAWQISPNLVGGLRGQLPRQCLSAPLLRRHSLILAVNPYTQRQGKENDKRQTQTSHPRALSLSVQLLGMRRLAIVEKCVGILEARAIALGPYGVGRFALLPLPRIGEVRLAPQAGFAVPPQPGGIDEPQIRRTGLETPRVYNVRPSRRSLNCGGEQEVACYPRPPERAIP
jgi:hypothetical protein